MYVCRRQRQRVGEGSAAREAAFCTCVVRDEGARGGVCMCMMERGTRIVTGNEPLCTGTGLQNLYVGRDVYGMYGKEQEQQRIVDFRTDNGKARFEDADRGW